MLNWVYSTVIPNPKELSHIWFYITWNLSAVYPKNYTFHEIMDNLDWYWVKTSTTRGGNFKENILQESLEEIIFIVVSQASLFLVIPSWYYASLFCLIWRFSNVDCSHFSLPPSPNGFLGALSLVSDEDDDADDDDDDDDDDNDG